MMARYNSAYSENNHWFARRGSIAAIIIGFLLLVCAVGGYLAYKSISTRLNSGRPHSKQESKTIYASAEKKHERLEAYESQTTTKTPASPKPTTVQVPPKQQSVSQPNSKSNGKASTKQEKAPVQTKTAAAASQAPTPSQFVSPAREWQPISPGLREATNRFKNLVYGGAPVTKHAVTILQNTPYYSAYSESRRNPLWVGYYLKAHKTNGRLPRPMGFITDYRTKAKVDQKVYTRTGYDRGHMCPNAAIASRYGKQGQIETFLMSNICPQKPELNRKTWERLERLEEAYANKFDGIYVLTGPIFDEHVEIMNKQVEIPDAFFKILVDEDKGKIRVLPFIVPQNVTGKEILNEFLTSVDEIEKRTGLDFFSSMDKECEAKLESYVPGKTMWN